MKHIYTIRCIVTLVVLFSCYASEAQGTTNILPGIKYYGGSEKLDGRLVLLLEKDFAVKTNLMTAASLFEFDLETQKLRQLTDAPLGYLSVSHAGDIFCVMEKEKNGSVFIFSKTRGLAETVNFDVTPNLIVPVNGHVLVAIGDTSYSKMIDYDLSQKQQRPIRFPNAPSYGYGGIYVPYGQTNVARFYYRPFGNLTTDAKKYPEGLYSLELQTGEASQTINIGADSDYDERYTFRAFDESDIGFEGGDSPRPAPDGFTLIASKNGSEKVLHRFSKVRAILNGNKYELSQISPDRHYALVSMAKNVTRKIKDESGDSKGTANTYYLVDLASGKTRIFLQDDVEAITRSSVWGIHWVQ